MTVTTTIEEIETAILNLLAASHDELVSWSRIRKRIGGAWDEQGRALHELVHSGRVYIVRVRGRNFIAIGDEHDTQMAAAAKAAGRVLEVRHL